MTGSLDTPTTPPVPRVVLIYGVLGLVPFLAPPLVGLLAPDQSGLAGTALALYGGLILSFLGGARWGMAIGEDRPRAFTITVAMIPTVAGLDLLLLPPQAQTEKLLGLAAALALHLLWDLRSNGPPAWYPRLRILLTLGAMTGLIAGAIWLRS
ncbi:DUF3429 domain-containing protein [Phenylobacterium sp.]|uniref:DUF3429 domain-containing protein n=1 Tax=Phenylobacterium sp. TaxID=1871053 RepID=UPI0025DBC581|nr:DUF3429 domain-containing protein [Phenylobacterium sp.]